MGLCISFSGVVTFKKADELRRTAAALPLDHLLVETDAPFLAPVPKRGKRNEPAYVCFTANEVARVRGVKTEALAAATTDTFFRLFAKARA
jgi:TatD DNase family protein